MSEDSRVTTADTRVDGSTDIARAALVIYGGGDAGSSVVEIPPDAQFVVGRTSAAKIVIDSERVSRSHARFSLRDGVLAVEDLGSRNGTWVNGEAIAAPRRLVSGDEVVVGPATIVVSITSPMSATSRLGAPRTLDDVLAAEVDRGKRYRRSFGLVMIRIAGHAADIEPAIERVARALRTMDTLLEYAPGELAVVLPELSLAESEQVARELVARCSTEARAGAAGFPDHGSTAGRLITRARRALGAAVDRDVALPPEDERPSDIVIVDPQTRRVFELIQKVAAHPITVLVYGETGVGKEVVASAIHAASPRRAGPLVRLNCAALPEALLESELFGYERGAFTGADRRKLGFFEAARGGTLFLDEIGELSLGTQAKLLRCIEARRITRVGGTEDIEVDVRLVCATHRDLEANVRRGTFRADLFFRIGAFSIIVPPLRDRLEEILPLAELFIARAAGRGREPPRLSEAARAALVRYRWPGNVRELRNAVERALVLHEKGVIEAEDLPDSVRAGAVQIGVAPVVLDGQRDVRDHMSSVERDAIVAALDACGGSQTDAALKLGISRRALIYRMEKHGLKPPPGARR